MSHETTLIDGIKEAIIRLQSAVDTYERQTKAARKNGAWKVPSRSGNRPHFVSLFDNAWSCSCAAANRGLECWAVKGVRKLEENIFTSARTSKFSFRDENLRIQHAEYLGET